MNENMNNKYNINDIARSKTENSIFITGCARSGTTIVGKTIHSMANVEYSFEPPTIISLLSQINVLDKYKWKMLFESYLYEDFLIPALGGRSINLNKFDDSSIYNVKSCDDIDERLSKSWRKFELISKSKESKIAFKIPSQMKSVNKLAEYYSDMKILEVRRNPYNIINSLLVKSWLNDENLKSKSTVIWPNFKYKDMNIPFWVDKTDFKVFYMMSEVDRCAYYVINQYNHESNNILINYEDLILNPMNEVERISHILGLEFGIMTTRIIKSIKPKSSTENVKDYSIRYDFRKKLDVISVKDK